MKRFSIALAFFAVLFSMVSCQKEQSTIIRASISPYRGGEKVYINDDYYACWDGSEQVWINGTDYGLAPIEGNTTYFQIVMTSLPTSGTVLNALYPSSVITDGATIQTSNNVSTISIDLPADQYYEKDNNSDRQKIYAPMVAVPATVNQNGGANLVFHNVCSLLKVLVCPNAYVHNITVTQVAGDNNTTLPYLAGPATVTFGSAPFLTMNPDGSNSSNSITLTVEASRSDGAFYIVVPPYTDATKLKVTVFYDPQTIYAVQQTSPCTLAASMYAVVDANDLDDQNGGGRGLFSVSATEKVSFARGNLTGSYSFEESQLSIGSQYSSLTNQSSVMGNEWFMLSDAQWSYLLNRTELDEEDNHAHTFHARVTVGTQHGLLLLPDNWYHLDFPGGEPPHTLNMNGLTIQEWELYEDYGAVFLPAHDNSHNYYWTSDNHYLEFGNEGSEDAVVTSSHHGNHQPYIRHAHWVVGPNTNAR